MCTRSWWLGPDVSRVNITMNMSEIALGPATMATALIVLPLTSLSIELLGVPGRYQLIIGSFLTVLYGLAGSAVLAVVIP